MGKTSTASHNRYNAKTYKAMTFRVKIGEDEAIKDHIKMTGESFNAFIQRAIQTQIEIDEQTAGFLHKPDTSDND